MYLQLENVEKYYGENENRVQVLKGVNGSIERGEICVMLGPSGSGKSTLLNLIGGKYDLCSVPYNRNDRWIVFRK